MCVWTCMRFTFLISLVLSALEVLPVAPPLPPRQLTEEEAKRLEEQEEDTLRELRLFLRDVTTRLSTDKRFKAFTKPVDLEEVLFPLFNTDFYSFPDVPTLFYTCARHWLTGASCVLGTRLCWSHQKAYGLVNSSLQDWPPPIWDCQRVPWRHESHLAECSWVQPRQGPLRLNNEDDTQVLPQIMWHYWEVHLCVLPRPSNPPQSMCSEGHCPRHHQRWTGWRLWEDLWGDQRIA